MNMGILFQINAAEIFPQLKAKLAAKLDLAKPRKKKAKPRGRLYSRASILKPTTLNAIPDPEGLPDELLDLATNLAVFLRQLEEFPEFADDTLTTSITALEDELKVILVPLFVYFCQFTSSLLAPRGLSRGIPESAQLASGATIRSRYQLRAYITYANHDTSSRRFRK
jgi:hypothetical protein